LSLELTGRKFLSVISSVLLLVAMSTATTKKKAHPATRHQPHPATHPAAQKHDTVHHSSPKTTKTKAHKHGRKTARNHGQKQIDSARAREIQAALVRANYMQGEPTGKWDQTTKDAMARFQADNGWQTKTVPDSRALIKLGLGPSQDHLLNPETAITTRPESVGGGQKESELPTTRVVQPTADGSSKAARVQPVNTPGSSDTAPTSAVQHAVESSSSQHETVSPSTPH
jgi:Putative peptidoglycan binding domain